MFAVCEMPRTFFDYSSAKVINITETCKRLTVFLPIFFLTSCVGNAVSEKNLGCFCLFGFLLLLLCS